MNSSFLSSTFDTYKLTVCEAVTLHDPNVFLSHEKRVVCSTMWFSSGKTILSVLHVDLTSCRYIL